MLINVLVGGNNLTAIMSLKRSSKRGVISVISGKQKQESPNPPAVFVTLAGQEELEGEFKN